MNKKTYTIEHDDLWWQCVISIDFDHENVQEIIRESVQFWSGWESRLRSNNYDYTQIFVKQLAIQILYIMVTHNYNIQGVKEEIATMEGWYPIDGSSGIELIEMDDFAFMDEDFKIAEIKIH